MVAFSRLVIHGTTCGVEEVLACEAGFTAWPSGLSSPTFWTQKWSIQDMISVGSIEF